MGELADAARQLKIDGVTIAMDDAFTAQDVRRIAEKMCENIPSPEEKAKSMRAIDSAIRANLEVSEIVGILKLGMQFGLALA